MPDATADASALPAPRAEAGSRAAAASGRHPGRRARRRRAASRSCCRAAPNAATTTAAPGSSPAASSSGDAPPTLLRRPRRRRSEPPARPAHRAASTTTSPRCANASRSRGCCSHAAAARPGRSRRRRCRPRSARGAAPCIAASTASRELCAREGLRLAVDRLAYLSHWLTPLGRAEALRHALLHRGGAAGADRRARRRRAGRAALDRTGRSAGAQRVAEAADADAEVARARRPLRRRRRRDGVGRGAARGRAGDAARRQRPRRLSSGAARRARLGRARPDRSGRPWPRLRTTSSPTGRCACRQRVIRVSAGNGSVMTGPGTNTYLVGAADAEGWAVIDPGPALDAHVDAIVAAAPGPIDRIFVTHTHNDHSPATLALKARTGATVLGLAPTHREWQDPTFAADVTLHGGERIALGDVDPPRGDPHAGPCEQPPLLPARGREDALHRRPRDAGVDRRHQSARRRHGGLPRVAARAARRSTSTGSRPATAS